MSGSQPEDRETENGNEEFVRFLKLALRELPDDAPLPTEDAILAYLRGTGTPDQSDAVMNALSRSASFRRAFLWLSDDLAALETPEFAERFASQQVAPHPARWKFILQRRLKRLEPFKTGIPPWVFLVFRVATLVLLAVLIPLTVKVFRDLRVAQNELSSTKAERDKLSSKVVEQEREIKANGIVIAQMKEQRQTVSTPSSWPGGPLSPVVLEGVVRGAVAEEDPRTVLKSPAQPFQVIIYDPSIPGESDIPDQTPYRIDVIRKGSSEPILRSETTASALRDIRNSPLGLQIIALPTSKLSAGEWVVRVVRAQIPPNEATQDRWPAQEFPFRVVDGSH